MTSSIIAKITNFKASAGVFMSLYDLDNTVTHAMRTTWSREFRIMRRFIALVLFAHLTFLLYSTMASYGNASGDTFTLSGGIYFELRIRIFVTIGLTLSFVGLTIGRLSGVVTSVLGATSLLLIYAWWKSKSVAFLKNIGASDYHVFDPNFPHVAGLWGGTWWDLVVFVTVVILSVWLASALHRMWKSPRNAAMREHTEDLN